MAFTDIVTNGFIRYLPERWQVYALLMRLDRPAGWWLLLLPSWWAIVLASGGFWMMSLRHWGLMVLFWAGAVIMRGAGCLINDLWDRDLDRKVERTRSRPIASGAVSVRQALIFLAILLSLGLLILLQLSWLPIGLGVLSLLLVVVYPLMKRVTWWPQAFLGLTFNFGVLIGWAEVQETLSFPMLVLYVGGIFWTLAYDTVYAHQDKEDDMLAGIKSTALLFGRYSKLVVLMFYILSVTCFVWSVWLSGYQGFALVSFVLPLGHMLFYWYKWQPDNQESALETFKSSRDFGFLVLTALFVVSAF
jgi:4-hydroxybenzoate polyprenyltransferase